MFKREKTFVNLNHLDVNDSSIIQKNFNQDDLNNDAFDNEGESMQNSWIVSFTDLTMLLLCFFIIIFLISSKKEALPSIKAYFKPAYLLQYKTYNLDGVKSILYKNLKDYDLENIVQVEKGNDSITLEFSYSNLVLSEKLQEFLKTVAFNLDQNILELRFFINAENKEKDKIEDLINKVMEIYNNLIKSGLTENVIPKIISGKTFKVEFKVL